MEKIAQPPSADRIVNLTREMVRIPSENPPGDERPVAQFLAEQMSKLGLKVEVFDVETNRPNAVGFLKGDGDGPTLMLNGHIDVVPAGELSQWSRKPYGGDIENGRLYGRGSADMKGGLAAMVGAVEAVVNSGAKLHGSLVVAGVMAEETTGDGTQALLNRGVKADAAIIGEPTDLEVEIAHKGMLTIEITTHGTAVHASTVKRGDPVRGVNAISKMARIVTELDKLLIDLERISHPLVGNPTISVGTISGGTKTNIVADTCRITVDRRLLPDDDWSKAYNEIGEIIRRLEAEDPLLKADLKLLIRREGAQVGRDEKIVKLAEEAVRHVRGVNPILTGCKATTDMAILMKAGGIPTVILGPGSLNQAHVADEFVEITQLEQAANIYTHIIRNFLNAE